MAFKFDPTNLEFFKPYPSMKHWLRQENACGHTEDIVDLINKGILGARFNNLVLISASKHTFVRLSNLMFSQDKDIDINQLRGLATLILVEFPQQYLPALVDKERSSSLLIHRQLIRTLASLETSISSALLSIINDLEEHEIEKVAWLLTDVNQCVFNDIAVMSSAIALKQLLNGNEGSKLVETCKELAQVRIKQFEMREQGLSLSWDMVEIAVRLEKLHLENLDPILFNYKLESFLQQHFVSDNDWLALANLLSVNLSLPLNTLKPYQSYTKITSCKQIINNLVISPEGFFFILSTVNKLELKEQIKLVWLLHHPAYKTLKFMTSPCNDPVAKINEFLNSPQILQRVEESRQLEQERQLVAMFRLEDFNKYATLAQVKYRLFKIEKLLSTSQNEREKTLSFVKGKLLKQIQYLKDYGIERVAFADENIYISQEYIIAEPAFPANLSLDPESKRKILSGTPGESFTLILNYKTGVIYAASLCPFTEYRGIPRLLGAITKKSDLPFRWPDQLYNLIVNGPSWTLSPDKAVHYQLAERICSFLSDHGQLTFLSYFLGLTMILGHSVDGNGAALLALRYRSRSLTGKNILNNHPPIDKLGNQTFMDGILSERFAKALSKFMYEEIGESKERQALNKMPIGKYDSRLPNINDLSPERVDAFSHEYTKNQYKKTKKMTENLALPGKRNCFFSKKHLQDDLEKLALSLKKERLDCVSAIYSRRHVIKTLLTSSSRDMFLKDRHKNFA